MINVRGIANRMIQPVNPDTAGVHQRSNGYTTLPSGKRNPIFVSTDVLLQVQAATAAQLKHIENINTESVYRNVRLWGNALGVSRPDVRGGDLLLFPQVPMGTRQTWLVVQVLESWPEWCSLIVCLQNDPVAP